MLILEGADNLGKTTCAKRMVELAADMGVSLSYRHMGRPAEDFDFCEDYFPMMERQIVQDRFHLGSMVWHKGVMTHQKLRRVEEGLRGVGAFVVVLAAVFDDYASTIDSSRELFSSTVIVNANRRYRRMIRGEGPYNPVIDCHHFMEHKSDWPTDEIMADWITRWKKVQDAIN